MLTEPTRLQPYTLAMMLAEALDAHGIDWTLTVAAGSDLELLTAAQGIYGHDELEGVPEVLRQRYFEPEYCDDDGRRTRRVVPQLRAHLRFERVHEARPNTGVLIRAELSR
jgi:chemotaxis methyl-accepting protein methylase